MKRLVNFKEMEEEEKEIVDEDVIEEGGEGKVKLKVMVNQSINQSKTLFNFKFVDSKIANISEENKSIK